MEPCVRHNIHTMDQTPKRRKTEADDPTALPTTVPNLDDEWERFQSEVLNAESTKRAPSVLDQYTPDLEAKALDIHGKSVKDHSKYDANLLEVPEDLKQREQDNLEEAIQELQQEEEVQEDLKSRLERVKALRMRKELKIEAEEEEEESGSESDFDEVKLWSQRGI
ncbi:hypothetical protein BKA91DRAFT_134193, partial [Yarrowia lipolytica]|uniref:Uncharacterized protein n=1 Tax=Yarrowia lipolytica TaxID=4952 RepID=A0A1D8N838_YARLL